MPVEVISVDGVLGVGVGGGVTAEHRVHGGEGSGGGVVEPGAHEQQPGGLGGALLVADPAVADPGGVLERRLGAPSLGPNCGGEASEPWITGYLSKPL